MPNSTETASATSFTVDRGNHSIQIARTVTATPEEVFRAWTDPRQVELWWDPAGTRLERCEIDLRVGGGFIFVNQGHSAMPFSGSYREIAPPTRLVFEAMGSIGEVLLKERNGQTCVVVTITCLSAEHLEHYLAIGVAAGTSQTLDNLVAYLAT